MRRNAQQIVEQGKKTRLVLEPHQVILKPLVTEKGMRRSYRDNQYAFEVNPLATKIDIRRSVESLIDVKVIKVNTMNAKGKTKRYGPRPTALKTIKKAIVQLAPGETITIFEGV